MTAMQNPTPTALMPLDPAVSPQQALRILPIRANLLPQEITAGRNARRTRTMLAAAIVVVIAVLGGWYLMAVNDRTEAGTRLADVTAQRDRTRAETQRKEYTAVTNTIEERKTIEGQLKAAMANDLPWHTLIGDIRDTGAKKTKVTSILGQLSDERTAALAAAKGGKVRYVGTLTIAGRAENKKQIAAYLDRLAKVHGVGKVYLTAAALEKPKQWGFSITAAIDSERLCGRFSTSCGGK